MTIQGEPIWLELMTDDDTAADTFYGGLFGWTFEDTGADFGGYRIIMLDGRTVGGAMQIDPQQMPGAQPSFALYLACDDIHETTSKVEQAGGTVLVPPMQIADQGWMAFYQDCTGAAIGAWQAGERIGFEARNTPGASSWYELMTDQYDKAQQFYRDVFGWDIHPMGPQGGEWQYCTLGEGENAKAGICDASQFVKGNSYWRVYFDVTDTRQAADQVQEMAGKLLDGPEDTPYGLIATVTDDQDAAFQLRS